MIGQKKMKLALLLNVIDPRIGGVMIMGTGGPGSPPPSRSGGSSAYVDVVAGDPYNSSPSDPDLRQRNPSTTAGGQTLPTEPRQVPMVDLPLGQRKIDFAVIDIEKALSEGVVPLNQDCWQSQPRLAVRRRMNLLDDPWSTFSRFGGIRLEHGRA